ncbi:MAG: hypothetical protein H0Z24_02310 [Thermosipho sp. (in: Bacteria)]|nr:hypothetical protein [Thermosipho sp. (in: thermotogales)]
MKRFLFVFFVLISVMSFSITIYPLVNRVNVEPGTDEFTLTINISNPNPIIAEVNVDISDFVIDGAQYVYDAGEYKYSIKDWITVEGTSLLLQPGESIDYDVKIKIPRNFRGAQAFGAIHFKQKGGRTDVFETVFDYVSIIILDFPVQKSIRPDILDVEIYDLTGNSSETLNNKYGDFGTVLRMKVGNNGNAVLAVNGELRLISREINRIITSIPLDNTSFVVFPERESIFEFFVPFIFPRGEFEIQLDGISQGLRVTDFKRITILGEQPKEIAVMIDPYIILIEVKRTIENYKVNIQNLSPESLEFSLTTDSSGLEILPSKVRLSPYTKISGFVKFDSRNESLKDGDNIFKINLESDKDILLFKNPVIVLRQGELVTDCDSYVTSVATDTFSVYVENTGNTILSGKIIRQDPLQSTDLTDEFVLFPGEGKEFQILLAYNEVIKNSTFIVYRKYGDSTYDKKKLIGDVRK